MAKTTINGEMQVTQTATFDGELRVTQTATFDGTLSADSIKVNGGGTVDLFQKYDFEVGQVTVTSGETHSATFTATGVVSSDGDFIFTQTPDGQNDDLISTAHAVADDVIKVKIHNVNKTTDITTTTETWSFLAISFV
jgi:hypothetical protein